MPFPRRLLVVAAATAGLVGPATSAARQDAAPRHCTRTFTLQMFKRAARATYQGTRLPRAGAYARLWRYARCQRRHRNFARARAFWGQERSAWGDRRSPPLQYSTASWYTDGGQTASGWHARYGVADCGSGGGPCYPFGTRIEFCYRGCVVATVDDHGPYVAGRAWDLGASTAQAIGFSGVDTVGWRVVG